MLGVIYTASLDCSQDKTVSTKCVEQYLGPLMFALVPVIVTVYTPAV